MATFSPPEKIRRAQIRILCQRGMHMRCAYRFINLLSQFKSGIRVSDGGKVIDARCIMDLLLLGVSCGKELSIEAVGDDADEAIEMIKSFFQNESNFSDHE